MLRLFGGTPLTEGFTDWGRRIRLGPPGTPPWDPPWDPPQTPQTPFKGAEILLLAISSVILAPRGPGGVIQGSKMTPF